MYHYPTVTYSQLLGGDSGRYAPKEVHQVYNHFFIIISRKAASDIRSRTVSVLEADSGLRFIGPYSTARIFNRTSPSPFISFFNTINSLTLPLSRQKTARRDTSISSLFLKLL